MVRNQDIKVKFSKEEKDKLRKEAEELGMKLGTYVRMKSLQKRYKLQENP